jgi:hypothetical protein
MRAAGFHPWHQRVGSYIPRRSTYGRELAQPRSLLDLGLFQTQSIGFLRAEDLLNSPPQSPEAHDFLGADILVSGLADRQRGKQPSNDRRVAFRRMNLAGLDIGERHSCRIRPVSSVVRLGDAHQTSLHGHTGAVASPGRCGGTLVSMVPSYANRTVPQTATHHYRAGDFARHARSTRRLTECTQTTNRCHSPDYRQGSPARPAERLAPNSRALIPAGRFFVFDRPWSDCGGLLSRSRPDARVHHSEHRLVSHVSR